MEFINIDMDAPNVTSKERGITFGDTDLSTNLVQDDVVDGTRTRVIQNMSAINREQPYDSQRIKKGIEVEVNDAMDYGINTIQVPAGAEKEAAQVAKMSGGTFEGGKLNVTTRPQAKQTSSSIAMSAYKAKAAGYSDDEIKEFLGDKEVDLDMTFSTMAAIETATAQGYTEEEILKFIDDAPTDISQLNTQNLVPAVADDAVATTPKQIAIDKIINDPDQTYEDLVASLKVIAPDMSSVSMRTMAFFGNEAAATIATQTEQASAQKIVDLAKSNFNLDMEWKDAKFFVNLPHGQQEVTPQILDTLFAEGGELTGALVGGSVGAFYGKKLGNVGAFLGSLVGAVGGAVLGTEVDYLRESIELHQEMSYDIAAHKALTAAEASAMGDVVGLGMLKGLGAGWDGIKVAKDFLIDGNTKGALKALQDTLFISDDQATEILTGFAKQSELPKGNENLQKIAAIMSTQKGSEVVQKAVSQADAQAGFAVTETIDRRAKDLLKSAASISDENVGKLVKEDLINYTSSVKSFYQQVKTQAAEAPRSNNFRFNFDALALDPILEKLGKDIVDPTTKERFFNQMTKINSMTETRSMSDLIELKQMVNDFKYNKNVKGTKNFEALNDVLTKIDGGIKLGAKVTMGEGAPEWSKNFAKANKEYSRMKGLEKNVMHQALTAKGVDEKSVVKNLTRYITSLDSTFTDIMEALPRATRFKAEGAVVEALTQKNAAGSGEGVRAINFPLLADDLNQIKLSSPNARALKAMVNEFSEVFKNDLPLAAVSGKITIPTQTQAMTNSFTAKVEYGVISELFNSVKNRLPTEAGRRAALVKNAVKVLKEPLNARASRELAEELGEGFMPDLTIVRQEAAKRAAADKDSTAALVKLYGEGAVKRMKGIEASFKIPLHRIATHKDVNVVAETDGILPTDKARLDFALKSRGYAGVQQGSDQVRVIK